MHHSLIIMNESLVYYVGVEGTPVVLNYGTRMAMPLMQGTSIDLTTTSNQDVTR